MTQRPAIREVRLSGARDEAATTSWSAARKGRARHGASRISAGSGWHLWVECEHCGSAYAFRPTTGRADLSDTFSARWVTACDQCGQELVLWSGPRWFEGSSLAHAS